MFCAYLARAARVKRFIVDPQWNSRVLDFLSETMISELAYKWNCILQLSLYIGWHCWPHLPQPWWRFNWSVIVKTTENNWNNPIVSLSFTWVGFMWTECPFYWYLQNWILVCKQQRTHLQNSWLVSPPSPPPSSSSCSSFQLSRWIV